jgi:hypothetical protein
MVGAFWASSRMLRVGSWELGRDSREVHLKDPKNKKILFQKEFSQNTQKRSPNFSSPNIFNFPPFSKDFSRLTPSPNFWNIPPSLFFGTSAVS